MNSRHVSPVDDFTHAAAKLGLLVSVEDRLEIAVRKLWELARECGECGGAGETREQFIALLLSDDRRLQRGFGATRLNRLRQCGPWCDPRERGIGVLRTPCHACAHIRQVIEICGCSSGAPL